jgi:hypothetical protein
MADDLVGLGKAAEQLIKTGEKFVERLLGPYLDEKGQQLADRVRLKRHTNLATIAGTARDIVGELPIHDIPGRMLLPLLEACANEDEPELQQLWARLVANTVIDPARIPASFPRILSELSTVEVRIINLLYNVYNGNADAVTLVPIAADDLHRLLTLPRDAVASAVLVLELRHNLIVKPPRGGRPVVELTELGTAFVQACTQPPGDRDQP